tara:strand:+ start:153 stop:1082 length:930 start_codon:yes stop_codon:yes gene_type:complete
MTQITNELERVLVTGTHRDVDRETYDAIAFLNASTIKQCLRSSKSAAHAMRKPQTESTALRFGTAFHTYVLEPERLGLDIAVAPDVDRRTKSGKLEYQEFVAASEGKTVISAKEAYSIKGMLDEIKSHRIANSYMCDRSGQSELTAVVNATPPYTVEQVTEAKRNRVFLRDAFKGRLDWVTDTAIVDVKTCVDASPRGVQRSSVQFGYHVQAAFYRELLRRATGADKLLPFVFIFVEKEPPFGVLVVELDEMFLEIGWTQCSKAIESVSDWMMFGHRDYAGGRKVTIECPQWLAQQNKERTESEYSNND